MTFFFYSIKDKLDCNLQEQNIKFVFDYGRHPFSCHLYLDILNVTNIHLRSV